VGRRRKGAVKYTKILSKTFASLAYCEMFLMVPKRQRPQLKGRLPGARFEIVHDTETPHMMQAEWTLQD